jgi:predicted KAP-like P-loop ATPase
MGKGFTDKAATVDAFGIEKYINGLNVFITSCNTPMTIAIQGDWGTGKTSMMTMIREKLGDKVQSAWFNTWQFSQFSMGDKLPILLLTNLMRSINDNETDNINLKQSQEKLGSTLAILGKKVAFGVLENVIGGQLADMAEKGLDGAAKALKGTKDNTEESIDMAQAIEKLKSDFQDYVVKALNANDKERLVIFVDDLDRLAPSKAVELLEVLKLFLDCEKCVFVLAIDYSVVSRGVADKYGASFDAEKGRSFFDKIIQVPFKLPVASYDISNYVKECFNEINLPCEDDAQLKNYIAMIEKSVGNNPRSIKRLFNTYLLLNSVVIDEILKTDGNKQALFAILCMQQTYEGVYNYIIRNRDNNDLINGETLRMFSDKERLQELPIYSDLKMKEDQAEKTAKFFKALFDVLDKDKDKSLSVDEVKSFINVLSFSTITAADTDATSSDKTMKKTIYEFNGDEYMSRKGGKHNIGYLAHDIIKEYASKEDKLAYNEFAELLRGKWKSNSWLRQITVREQEKPDIPHKDREHYLLDSADVIPYGEERIFVSKYWGGVDIEKLIDLLPEFKEAVIKKSAAD